MMPDFFFLQQNFLGFFDEGRKLYLIHKYMLELKKVSYLKTQIGMNNK